MAHAYDLVIRSGDVADGSGGPLRQAVVATSDGKIVSIGRISQSGREEIDAKGKRVRGPQAGACHG
jgi:N-acyl-D-amino-acid deacylase